jgi:serine/threonine protein kinase/tetratricopeptide (TPR) repeat protein
MPDARLFADRFELLGVAGIGGMGTVHRAKDQKTGAIVAVKVLSGMGLLHPERFEREARFLSELVHPGIVRYVASSVTSEGAPYLVMEWLEGENLSRLLTEQKTLGLAESVALVRRVAEALGTAHARGVVHRDVKPTNVFLVGGRTSDVKLLDFGIARRGGEASALTMVGTMLGTPGYSAPEQVRGAKRIDPRADVFALACVLWKCLAGRSPFAGPDSLAVLAKVLFDEAPRIREVVPMAPPELDDLLARMLSKDRALRPANGTEVARELEGIERQLALRETPPATSSAPGALTGRERRLVSVVVAWGGSSPTGETTLGSNDATSLIPRVGRIRSHVSAFGARLESIPGGPLLATLRGDGTSAGAPRRGQHRGVSATDLAVRAARCALAMKEALSSGPGDPEGPSWSVALATGSGELDSGSALGDVIDRATSLVRTATPGSHVRVDETTAGLVALRFEIGGDTGGLALLGERPATHTTRRLLGMPTPTVGRDREIRMLRGLYDDVVENGVARAVLITGAPGLGKSRLRYELVRWLRQRGDPPQIWMARGDPMTAPSAFALLGELLVGTAGITHGEPLDIKQKKLRARLARGAPRNPDLARLVAFLGELVGIPAVSGVDTALTPPSGPASSGAPAVVEPSVQLRAARRDVRLMADQMRRAWEDFLAAECDAGPVVVVLEDLQWGDLPTVTFVEAALRALDEKPLLVVAVARPEIDDIFPRLWSDRPITRIALTPLTSKASERLARAVLWPRVPEATITRIAEHAHGNAFYLEELIRSVAAGGGKEEGNGTIELPDTVLAMVQARLEALETDARRLLRAASVFGLVFWAEGAFELLGAANDTVRFEAWLEELAARELIAERDVSAFGGTRAFVFRQSVVREAAYAMLTDSDKKLGHRLAAEWLERAGSTDAMLLAEHHERGQRPSHATAFYLRATEEALRANDFRAAIERAERAIASGALGAEKGAMLLAQAEAHNWLGQFQEAEASALRALDELTGRHVAGSAGAGSTPDSDDRYYLACGELAIATGRFGQPDRLAELVMRLRNAKPSERASAARVEVLARVAVRLFLLGKGDLARPLLLDAEASVGALPVGDAIAMGRVFAAEAIRALFDGDSVGYLEKAKAAVASFEAAGNLRDACVQRVNVGGALSELGAYAEAEAVLRETATMVERLRMPSHLAATGHTLCIALAQQGRNDPGKLAEALAVAERALAVLAGQADARMEAGTRVYRAMVLGLLGQKDESLAEARRAIDVAPPGSSFLPFAHAVLADALLKLGETERAVETARGAMEMLLALPGTEGGESTVRLVLAEALAASGDRTGAVAAIREARDRLLARADELRDPAWRESLLTKVPEHARTLELAEAWDAGGPL